MATNKYLLIITLNINGLNAPIKRHRVAEWIRKHDPYIFCLQETHLRMKDSHRLRVTRWKQFFQANRNENKQPGPVWLSGRASVCGLKGPGFDSGQGHVPWLRAHPQWGVCKRQLVGVSLSLTFLTLYPSQFLSV
uniref:exodeoxyribonuclease III n=1 Tax=Pipistrellus kuhlii TaxID=59472 RepID=A0A7J7X094_PIPKU|nr:hypothetical protein mPipKuh1_010796 [Pipistrellus kuhlii]